ncbi:MAG: hypothetical protein ISR78_08620 [Spirochaetia bacterium]|nr:hypothetical protein [Spirochaetia bacterium]
MFFGGRMKRQQAIGKISDPLVHNSNLTMTELLKTQIGKETEFPVETLYFSMWLVYLGFSTVKPNPSKKEGQALNDSYNQMFINIAGEAYKTSELRSQIGLVPYSTQYAQDLMNYFINRCGEYNDAFNMDKGTAFATSENDFADFVPSNLLPLAIKNIYGEQFAIFDPSSLDKAFVSGFMDFFSHSVSVAARDFERFSL